YGVTDAGVGVYSLLSTTGSVLIDTARFKNPITSWNYYSNQSFGWVGQTYDWMDQNIRRQEDDGIVFTISRGASRLVADTYGAGKLTRCVSPAKSLPVVPKRTVIATPQLRVAPPPVPSQTIYSHPVQSPWIQPNRLLSSMDKMYRGPSNKGIRVKQIWTSTKKRTSVQNAFEHWKDHGNEFPELLNSKQYVEQAHNFFTGRGQLSTKIRPNGEILIYDAEANIFGTFTGEGVPKTMFKPTDGMLYWERN
ncbi:MAG: rhs15, partial [Parachlamydiales bacterium]|nr:rhs15 [Parachlamydiales bacterium]